MRSRVLLSAIFTLLTPSTSIPPSAWDTPFEQSEPVTYGYAHYGEVYSVELKLYGCQPEGTQLCENKGCHEIFPWKVNNRGIQLWIESFNITNDIYTCDFYEAGDNCMHRKDRITFGDEVGKAHPITARHGWYSYNCYGKPH
ncbi:hypothetical protein BU23DRAFT_260272 [Bimuria novae-zelandiae CBS 107.79]|uniref:Secreted protein n=1 Tax=Bimuria novae-zelandiae CBS 107.79 TaxID=1447943 RepID=A0A6A5UTX9_9PLEO|nr:hypothetical protein BU23DRAFT_260272 [Bimuria novae-zelandiae CBS 107.79]